MSVSELFLGIDGGQSATKAVVGDADGRILGRGKAGPCNHVKTGDGRAKLEGAVRDAVTAALSEAGVDWQSTRFRAACFGMSGGPADKQAILEALIAADSVETTTDARTALLGAVGGGPGVMVIAGTGSIALAQDAAGRQARAGGWGYVFGDEGGAFDLVRQAVRAALRMEEGWGPDTLLRDSLLTAAQCQTVNDVMHAFYTDAWPRSRVAALAPLVTQAAEAGDAAAAGILETAGADLARYAAAARNQLFPPMETVPVAYVGGVFRSQPVLESFGRSMRVVPGCAVGPPRFDPDLGALLGAYRLAGLSPELKTCQ